MKNLMDLHTHTLASVHAYSTLRENARMAKDRDLKILGTSDHGYKVKNSTKRDFFTNYHVIPKFMEGVRILKGIELNIGDVDGSVLEQELIDWKKKYEEPFDYTIASIHRNSYVEITSELENTNAFLKAIENPDINIIGHIDDGNIPIKYEEIMHKASEYNVAIELNNTSAKPENYRLNSVDNMYKFLEYGKKYNTIIVLNTDAHIDYEVGNIDLVLGILKNVNYKEDLIVNYSIKLLENIIGKEVSFEN